jgi:hypothetical protein
MAPHPTSQAEASPYVIYQGQAYAAQIPRAQQPIYVQQMPPQQPSNVNFNTAEKVKAVSLRWGRVVRALAVILLGFGAFSFTGGVVHLASGHGVDHVGPYLHLTLSLFMMCTGVKGVKATKQTTVKSAKRYLCSVSLLSLIVLGGFVVGFALMAAHPRPKDVNFAEEKPDMVAGSDHPCFAPEERTLLPAGGQLPNDRPHNGDHSKPDQPHNGDYSNNGDRSSQPHNGGHSSHPHNDNHSNSGRSHHREHSTRDQGSNPHHGPHLIIPALISTFVCSIYIISAVKLLKARKALNALSQVPATMPHQPQYQVSQAMPIYGAPIYQNLSPVRSQV